jgi:hypothetical protein
MRKYLSITILFFCLSLIVLADTPGKATMYDSQISFQNIEKFKDYNFYWSSENGNQPQLITKDITESMASTHGAPMQYIFWAVNKATQKSTDTVEFHNYYAPDYVIILNSLAGDSIGYTQKELSNKNKIVSEGNTDDITNKELVVEAKKAKRNHYIKVVLFSLLGIGALAGLIWYFVKRKRSKQTAIEPEV